MAARRRPKGSVLDPIQVGFVIERSINDRIDAIAQRSGISRSYLIEQLVDHVELNDQGVPTWLPELSRDGELPIDTA